MARGQSYADYLAEELADDEPQLSAELEESYKDTCLAVQLAMLREQRKMTQQQLA